MPTPRTNTPFPLVGRVKFFSGRMAPFWLKNWITFPTGDLKEREKDKEVTPGSKDFCQL
ncbi:hypothetical protein BREVNS_2440 [Brevinematales bacterium NS]|nr:hypothetical protein BREVNS_2440 [Brevinematales bacterium NS]